MKKKTKSQKKSVKLKSRTVKKTKATTTNSSRNAQTKNAQKPRTKTAKSSSKEAESRESSTKKTKRKVEAKPTTKVLSKKKKVRERAPTKAAKVKSVEKPKVKTSDSTESPAKSKPAKPLFRAWSPAPEPIEPERKPPSETQLRKVKSGLSRKELNDYRRGLMQKRAEILGDMMGLANEVRTDSGDQISPEHMADIGSSNFEQEFALGLVESERKMLQEIDEALLRIQRGTYGVCLERAVPIGKARLDAKPWAKYCIEAVREKERRGEI